MGRQMALENSLKSPPLAFACRLQAIEQARDIRA